MGLDGMTTTLPVSTQAPHCLPGETYWRFPVGDSEISEVAPCLEVSVMLFCSNQQKLQFSHPYGASVRIN